MREEVWLRGPLEEIPALLQPVAHALLQAEEELYNYLSFFPDKLLHEQPAGVASVAFHLKHIVGVLDRMVTYSINSALSDEQFTYLKKEKIFESSDSVESLLKAVSKQVKITIQFLQQVPTSTLSDFRPVGRKQLPSTVIGLLFHAAEHTQRHVGQVYVTSRILLQPD